MTFFNKKTEVMKVELTPLGRYKLSIGKLSPHHYRFFDNNVIYDGKAIGITEDQNDADHRIRQETPILKQNPNITGVETMLGIIETENLEVQMHKARKNERDDHINQLIYNLGTIEHDAEQSPSIQLDAFRGKLSGSTTKFYSSDNIQTSSVPQIDLTLEYEISVTDNLLDAYSNNFDIQSIGPFEDGSRLIIKKQDPLLRIKETNAFDEKENFHITAYRVFHQEVASGADNSVIYEKMRFAKREQRIMHDLYVGEQDIEPDEFSVTDIPYYFEILVDKEIAESDYCATIGDLPIRNIYLDDEIICPDQQEDLSINIYQSQVRPEDLEDCD
jgi:hypothetical protein